MPTQNEIATHLDLDQSAVSRMLDKLEIPWQTSSMDEIRLAYIRNLRAQASGHRSADGMDLVRERVLTERVDREFKQLQIAEKRGLLINVSQLEPELMNMVSAFRSELLSRDDKLVTEIETLYGVKVDVNILNEHTYAALSQLVKYSPGDRGFDRPSGGNDGAAGAHEHNGVVSPVPGDIGEGVGPPG